VHKSVHKMANISPFYLSPINLSYADNGLAGFYLAADGTMVRFIFYFHQIIIILQIYPYVKAAVQGLRELAANSVDEEMLGVTF
jgi:hypothetical protein